MDNVLWSGFLGFFLYFINLTNVLLHKQQQKIDILILINLWGEKNVEIPNH